MPASVTSPADVVNLALRRLGRSDRVGNLYDGSAAAKAALDIYAQTRDALLRQSDWGFAEKIAAAVPSGTAAPAPWSVEYTYPADCMRLRNLFNAAYLADKNNPLPVLYTVADDPARGKVIWCNAAAATLVYTAQVTDPARWEPLFVNALAESLARWLGSPQGRAAVPESGKAPASEERGMADLARGIEG